MSKRRSEGCNGTGLVHVRAIASVVVMRLRGLKAYCESV